MFIVAYILYTNTRRKIRWNGLYVDDRKDDKNIYTPDKDEMDAFSK